MAQYQVEALRTIRAIQRGHEKAGHTAQAEQMRRIGDQVEAMQAELFDWQERANEHANNSAAATTELIGLRAELAALNEAARPVVKWWRKERMVAEPPYEIEHVVLGTDGPECVGVDELDALAALAGEE